MASKIKCPECNGCMSAQWIMPNRYYFCEFCRIYYAGMDKDLHIVPDPHLALYLNSKEFGSGEKE